MSRLEAEVAFSLRTAALDTVHERPSNTLRSRLAYDLHGIGASGDYLIPLEHNPLADELLQFGSVRL